MYGKLFASLYQGTLRGRPDELLVFTNLIACADADGVCDKHPRAIAEEVGLPIERVHAALAALEAPDPDSRSQAEDGARLIRIDEHRSWGWMLVNYQHYRDIRDPVERRKQVREAVQRHRTRRKESGNQQSSDVIAGNQSNPLYRMKAKAEAEAEEEAYKKELEESATPTPRASSPTELAALWNRFSPPLPKCRELSATRRKAAQARLRAHPEHEYWLSVVARIADSAFCKGENDRAWKATFDWLLRPDTSTRVLEGKYDSTGSRTSSKSSGNLANLKAWLDSEDTAL